MVVGGIEFVPEDFRYYAEHSPSVEFEEAGINGLQRHVDCWQLSQPIFSVTLHKKRP